MWFFYFNVGLTYLTIGVAAAVFFYFVLKKPVLGKFWGAIIVGLIGSFLGGLVDQLFGGVIKYLSEFNNGTVNVFAAAGAPPTASARPGDYFEAYKQLVEEGKDEIISIQIHLIDYINGIRDVLCFILFSTCA